MTEHVLPKKQLVFIRSVIYFTFSSFGGAQSHLAHLQHIFVTRRSFISQTELLELFALSQILPGPASTQTLVAMGYRVGGLRLALITALIWLLPGAAIMFCAAVTLSRVIDHTRLAAAAVFIQPLVIAVIAHAAISLYRKMVTTRVSLFLVATALFITLILRNAYVFPLAIVFGGIVSSAVATPPQEMQLRQNLFSNINQAKVLYFLSFLGVFALLGKLINLTSPFSLPIRLFENFYRNGILVFGGGQVLVPLMFTEFVQIKHYLTAQQFLTGYGLQQIIPGPTFSFTSYLAALTMQGAHYGFWGQLLGGTIGVLGINLPGIILILFIVPFWNQLKQISQIKNSLSGINAVSVGFIAAAALLMLPATGFRPLQLGIIAGGLALLNLTRISPALLLSAGFAFAVLGTHLNLL